LSTVSRSVFEGIVPVMHANAADPVAALDHEHRFLELGRLHRRAPPGGPAADHDKVVAHHRIDSPAPWRT
jgi:hypothetical protein